MKTFGIFVPGLLLATALTAIALVSRRDRRRWESVGAYYAEELRA